ncbi:MAG TPA: hypothetical protein VFQ58_00840 [Flavisolibacter sp.]|jgi:hypothetical protein|nr:hypothetical protein [Flavisolibacter sp.]
MFRQKPYDFITKKLEQHNEPDINTLWEEIHQLLDNHLPEKETNKKPFFIDFKLSRNRHNRNSRLF